MYPLGGHGIGQFVGSAANLLARVAEVTVITTSLWEERYRELKEKGDPRLPDPRVRFAFVKEPSVEETEGWYHVMQSTASRVLERLRELYPDGGPDIIEFPDFLGEGFVIQQAAETLDPLLARTCICVRLHTAAEMCEVLDGSLSPTSALARCTTMERYSLARADRLIWQGGDILGTYRRYYGSDALTPAVRIRYPYAVPRPHRTTTAAVRGRARR